MDKFPERFSWKLTNYESEKILVEIFDQKNLERRGGKYKNPRVFTEQGVSMLATILKSKTAKKDKVEVTLITSSHYLTKLDINKFNSQYPNLIIKYSNIFHDRFLIIDNTLYHVGASLKDLGKKCFGINKIEDKEYLNKIIEKTN